MCLALSLQEVNIVNNFILFLRRKAWIWAGVHQGKSWITGVLYLQVSGVWYRWDQIDVSHVNIKGVKYAHKGRNTGSTFPRFPTAIKNKILINYSRVGRKISWLFTLISKGSSVHWEEFSIARGLWVPASFSRISQAIHFSLCVYLKNSAQGQCKGLQHVQNHTSLSGDPMAKSNWIAFSFSLCNIKYSYLQQWKVYMDWSNTNYVCHII